MSQLEAILAYVREQSPSSARKLNARIESAIDRLKLVPQSGRRSPENRTSGLRELIVMGYRIVYSYDGDVVT